MLLETLFDLFSASTGAICGALFAFLLNRKRNKKMSSQLVVSRQALDKIKLENETLLKQIHDKENMILQMQMEILGNKPDKKNSPKKKQSPNRYT